MAIIWTCFGTTTAALAAGGCLLLTLIALIVYLATEPDHNVGHRAGSEEYTGPFCENTIESLRNLVMLDNGNSGPVKDLHYVEIDVQETRDGEVVVFHDVRLHRAFPREGPNVPLIEKLESEGLDFDTAPPQMLTLGQLQSLHLGGREGLRVPTLQQFMQACQESGLRRPLVVEVKILSSDRGRERLLELLRSYKLFADEQQRRYPSYAFKPFGFIGVISFPFMYEISFGKLGSEQWRRWSREMLLAGLAVRSCHLHILSLAYSAGGS